MITIGNVESIRISVYLPKELKDRIQEMAKLEHRTMNDLIVSWIKDRASIEPLNDTIKMIIERLESLENKK